MKNNNVGNGFFRRISLITLLAVYFLILVGGIVRSSGSGMGCPDWPKCFGAWIPPSSVADLPADYQQDYVAYRMDKIRRFASYLESLGLENKASMIRNDASILKETSFNRLKTWTEYINRLTGVMIGLLITVTMTGSVVYIRKDPRIFVLSVASFFLVVFQGWIGSVVVSSNLTPWTVTLHMILAVILVSLLTYIVFRARRDQFVIERIGKLRLLNGLLGLSLVFVAVQIFFGTQVRESVDTIAAALNYNYRNAWVEQVGAEFLIHRSFSIVILGCQLGILFILLKNKNSSADLLNFANILMGFMLLEVGLGAIMAYFGIPAFAQPLHLLLAVLVFGLQMFMILVVNNFNIVHKNLKIAA